MLSFRDVTVQLGATTALDSIDLDVPGGGITVVVGHSGSGKSTLARLCNRLIDPTSGVVLFNGVAMTELPVLGLRRKVGLVFQRPALLPGRVDDNLMVTGVTDVAAHRRVLRQTGLNPETFLERNSTSLSGGEAQRVCLARALLTEPDVLVADEPTASLDPHAAQTIESLARSIVESGTPVLWITHDLDQMDRMADHVVMLSEGRVLASATLESIRRSDHPGVAAFLSAPENELRNP